MPCYKESQVELVTLSRQSIPGKVLESGSLNTPQGEGSLTASQVEVVNPLYPVGNPTDHRTSRIVHGNPPSRQSTITGPDWWTRPVDWTGGLTFFFALKITFMLSKQTDLPA